MIDGLKSPRRAMRRHTRRRDYSGMGEFGGFSKGTIQSHHDHRIAMSFSIASLRAIRPITIEDCQFVATSFPTFVDICNEAGMQIDVLTKVGTNA